jgi:hypothetical protein
MVWFFYFILWNLVGCIFIFDKLRDINIKIGNRHLNLVDIFIILRPPPIALYLFDVKIKYKKKNVKIKSLWKLVFL